MQKSLQFLHAGAVVALQLTLLCPFKSLTAGEGSLLYFFFLLTADIFISFFLTQV